MAKTWTEPVTGKKCPNCQESSGVIREVADTQWGPKGNGNVGCKLCQWRGNEHDLLDA